ncbi:MAG: PQQ-binding-like beta-propeller repeat protein, partial [Candidatus Bathyarchaeia archaeon]
MKKIAFICLVFVSLVLTSSVFGAISSAADQPSVGSWPMFHNDLAHSGFSNSQAPETNQTLWEFNTGGQVDSPTVVDGVVYVGAYDH